MTDETLTSRRINARGASRASGGSPSTPARSAATSRSRRLARRRSLVAWAFVAPAAVYLAIFFGYPIINNVVMSFQDYTTATFYTGEAPFVGLANYAEVVSSGLFARLTFNTVVFTLVSLVVTFVLGLLLALFFNARFPLSGALRSLVLLPWLLPLIISAAVWRRMMDEGTGILNQIIGSAGFGGVPWLTSPRVALASIIIVNVWIGIPFVMVILYGGLQEISKDFYEAAALDGATGGKAFWTSPGRCCVPSWWWS